MVDINQKERAVRVKIVYYGPALGGKTTNLRVLHEHALWARRGEFVSVNSMQDRTILCDLLPLRSGGFRGFDLKLQLVAVPGQAMYGATRRVVLKAADGIVFVANSASDRRSENDRSREEMEATLVAHQLDPNTIPLVLQYNKRDLPSVLAIETMQREINVRHVTAIPSVATRGEGVLETFTAILGATVADLARRYRTMELPPGQSIEDWTRQAVAGMFGCERFAQASDEAQAQIELADGSLIDAEPNRLRVQVATPQQPDSPMDERSPEALTASYAETSAELGFVVSELREERDAALARLAEMRRAVELATEAPGTGDSDSRLRRILQVLADAGRTKFATLRLGTGEAIRVLALDPLRNDPLSRTAWGHAHLEALLELPDPIVEEATESAELCDGLRAGEPSFEAVVLVPLRSAERLLGLALLYYDLHAVLPSRDTLAHLGYLGRELASPLEAAAASQASADACRSRALSRTSSAAVASLVARLDASAIRRQPIDLADMLEPLRLPALTVEVPVRGAIGVAGDPPLLRFAFASLVRLCEADALDRGLRPRISIRAARMGDDVRVTLSCAHPASSAPPAAEDDDAEVSVAQAIVSQHGGTLVHLRQAGRPMQFQISLPCA